MHVSESFPLTHAPRILDIQDAGSGLCVLEPNPLFAELIALKQKIDDPPYQEQWDEFKRLLSPYELIHVSRNSARHLENIANVVPLSRSYFKMIEMLQDFKIFAETKAGQKVVTAHIAEGPGGFVEATCHTRRGVVADGAEDAMYGITLKPKADDAAGNRDCAPGWSAAASFLRRNPHVKLHYGHDDTGDLCNLQNIDSFVEHVGEHSCALVTGDGGFDFSTNFSKQEENSLLLIMCEVYTSLRLVARGGTIVCKFFDAQMPSTVDVMNALSYNFFRVSITKPACSRPANSERYVVAQNYHGKYIDCVASAMRRAIQTAVASTPSRMPGRLFEANDPRLLQLVGHYNHQHAVSQISAISKCLAMIDAYNLQEQSLENQFSEIMRGQIQCGYTWCQKYGISTNPSCIYKRSGK